MREATHAISGVLPIGVLSFLRLLNHTRTRHSAQPR